MTPEPFVTAKEVVQFLRMERTIACIAREGRAPEPNIAGRATGQVPIKSVS